MGCGHHPNFIHHLLSLLLLTIPLIILLLTSFAQGRMLVNPPPTHPQVEVEETILRGQIGSRPPRCERRCGSCGHCEAIQVPTTPQIKGVKNPTLEYARGDYSSNYKPMSWKCKCGSFIFNP